MGERSSGMDANNNNNTAEKNRRLLRTLSAFTENVCICRNYVFHLCRQFFLISTVFLTTENIKNGTMGIRKRRESTAAKYEPFSFTWMSDCSGVSLNPTLFTHPILHIKCAIPSHTL